MFFNPDLNPPLKTAPKSVIENWALSHFSSHLDSKPVSVSAGSNPIWIRLLIIITMDSDSYCMDPEVRNLKALKSSTTAPMSTLDAKTDFKPVSIVIIMTTLRLKIFHS